jgi:hypothetical protein
MTLPERFTRGFTFFSYFAPMPFSPVSARVFFRESVEH